MIGLASRIARSRNTEQSKDMPIGRAAAIAEATNLLVSLPTLSLTIGYGIVILFLQILVPYRGYARILKFLALSLLAYPITLFVVSHQW